MPVYPLELKPLVKDGDYPHMQKRDVEIWERFIDLYGGNFPQAAYDVALGGVVVADRDADPAVLLGFRYATAIKVDALVVNEQRGLVIEVKPRASLGALGQALGAALLLEADKVLPVELFPAIVTDRANPDVKFCAEELGVLVFEVGESAPPGDGWLRPEFPAPRFGRELEQGGAIATKDDAAG